MAVLVASAEQTEAIGDRLLGRISPVRVVAATGAAALVFAVAGAMAAWHLAQRHTEEARVQWTREQSDEAHRRRPDLKVLFTTGYARNAIIHHGRLDPGVELLVKPFSQSDMAGKVRRVLGNSLQR
jgi:hypothetical protein